jgi:thioredoxin-related protein
MRFLFYILLLTSVNAFATDSTRMYNPYANAEKDMAIVLAKAKNEKKHVLVVIGNNNCIPCYRLNSFILMDSTLRSLMNNYVVYHLNCSKENENTAYLKKLGLPQQFTLPTIVVLDMEGSRLYIQDCEQLQKGNGYDMEKVKNFLNNWILLKEKQSQF